MRLYFSVLNNVLTLERVQQESTASGKGITCDADLNLKHSIQLPDGVETACSYGNAFLNLRDCYTDAGDTVTNELTTVTCRNQVRRQLADAIRTGAATNLQWCASKQKFCVPPRSSVEEGDCARTGMHRNRLRISMSFSIKFSQRHFCLFYSHKARPGGASQENRNKSFLII